MIQLVRFDCGCIGTVPVNGMTHTLRRCDHGCLDDDDLLYAGFPRHANEAKRGNGDAMPYVPLDDLEYRKVMDALFEATKAGNKWMKFTALLRGEVR